MKKFLVVILFFILILTNILYTVNAVTITEDEISNSIDNLNSILKDKIDATNPNYLTEILDENNNVPSYEYYPKQIQSRSIKTLKAYDGKIFMGLGDWNSNTGPAKIIYFDTKDEKIKSSGTIADDAVQQFTVIDDTLYTTGCDPRASWGHGSYYTYNKKENKWEQHLNDNGWIHVFNIVEFKDKLFMCGSTVDTYKKSTIQASSDNGETFESIKVIRNGQVLPYDSELRCYNLVVYNNKLYGYINYSSYTGIYEYDEEKNEFNYISNLPSGGLFTVGLSSLASYNNIYLRYNEFNGKFLYVSGVSLYTSEDLKTFNRVSTDANYVIQDVVVNNDTLYTLSYRCNSDKTYTARIYSTKDLVEFDLVYDFTTTNPPFCIEYYDNSIYVGTGYYYTAIDSKVADKNGALYRINLEKAKRSIKLNKKDKTLQITDNGVTYDVKYDLSDGKVVFKTDLVFEKTMSKKQWEQEYTNLKNLNLAFATIADINGADFEKSISYYNRYVSKSLKSSSETYSNAIEYAKDMFSKEIDVQDDLFTVTTSKISSSEDEYKTQVVLTVNNDGDFSDLKSITSDDTTDNTNENIVDNNNTTIDNNNDTSIDTNIDKENENNNNSNNNNSNKEEFTNSTFPQAGIFFSLKNLLQIIIFVAVIIVAYLIIKEKKQ